jgi:trans-aconitate methyltransferase
MATPGRRTLADGVECVTIESDAQHWDDVYDRVGADRVSWYQPDPTVSAELIGDSGPVRSVVDVGGGASVLVDVLLDAGIEDVTVLDLSARALDVARQRLGSRGDAVRWVEQDVRSWQPERRFDLWHDRAVFHFLTEPADRDAYRSVLREALEPRGRVVIGTFAADGPTHCSGLPVARYGPAELAAEFPGMRTVEQRRVVHLTPGGATQPFTWLLLGPAS